MYEKLECPEERRILAKEIYDNFIMKELLAHSHPYIEEIFNHLRGEPFKQFLESEKYTRFCQWKNLELNMQLTMNDFSVHRIIGRGGLRGGLRGAGRQTQGKCTR